MFQPETLIIRFSAAKLVMGMAPLWSSVEILLLQHTALIIWVTVNHPISSWQETWKLEIQRWMMLGHLLHSSCTFCTWAWVSLVFNIFSFSTKILSGHNRSLTKMFMFREEKCKRWRLFNASFVYTLRNGLSSVWNSSLVQKCYGWVLCFPPVT